MQETTKRLVEPAVFIVLLLMLWIFLFATNATITGMQTIQATCGGATACNCGDILTSSRILDGTDNLQNCPDRALEIDPDYGTLTLDCNSQPLSGAPGNIDSGIYIMWSALPNTITIIGCNISHFKRGIWRENAGLLELFNSTLFYNEEGVHNGGTLYATNNEIAHGGNGIHQVDNSDTIFKNKIYNHTYSILSDTAAEVSHNGEGNYWGHPCPDAFLIGVDSNNAGVIDSFPYGAPTMMPQDQCHPIGCGDLVNDSINLTEDLNCTGTALIVNDHDVTIDCNGYSITGDGTGNGIQIANFDGLTVENCEISNFNRGIDAANSDDGLARFNILHHNADSGLYWDPSNNVTIFDNSAYNNSNGFYFFQISNSALIYNWAYENGDGIRVPSCSNLHIEGNVIENNTVYGARIQSNTASTLINNTIYNNELEGIAMALGADFTMHDNMIYDNNRNGMHIINTGGTNNITENKIFDNEASGVIVEDGGTFIIYRNQIFNNSLLGLFSVDNPVAVILDQMQQGNYWGHNTCPAFIPGVDSNEDDIFAFNSPLMRPIIDQCPPECGDTITEDLNLTQDYDCPGTAFIIGADDITIDCDGYSIMGEDTGNGIQVANYDRLTVQNCEIENFHRGIDAANSDHGVVRFNDLHDNVDVGVHWDPSSNLTIFNNTAYDNSMQGFYLEDITDGVFINNHAYNNTRNGLHPVSCINLLVENNVLEYNGYNGMHIDVSEYIFANNTVNDNIRDGLHDTGGSDSSIYNNTIFNNTENGIRFVATTGLSNITGNTITENKANGLVIDGNDFMIYLNQIHNNTGRELMVGPVNIVNLFYMQQGNYWGHNDCPAYVPGVDSNDVVLNDTFAFTSPLMRPYIDQCIGSEPLECEDTINNSVILTEDLNCLEDGLIVEADNVIIDCDGHTLTGNDNGNGIQITGFDGLTVQNCDISHFDVGIRADTSDDGVVRFNNLHSNVFDGVYWDPSDNVTFIDNHVFNNSRNGISVHDMTNVTIINNWAYNQTRDGIYGTNIASVYIANNTLENNLFYGAHIDNCNNCEIENNSFHDDGTDGFDYYGGFLCRWCGGVTIYDNKIYNSLGFGIQIEAPTAMINITDNKVHDGTRQGIKSINSENLVIRKNYIYNNSMEGIYMTGGAGNTIYDNDVIGNELGIYVNSEEGMLIDNNDIKLNNEEGILFSESLGTISNNYVQNNCEGIALENGAEATIVDTDFDNNTCGDTGLSVNDISYVELINGNFIYNNELGINAEGTVEWTLLEDVLCIDNDIVIDDGWIIPLGGDIIPDNCTIEIDGMIINFSEGVSGYVEVPLDTTGGNGTVGGNETGVELEVHTGTDFTGEIEITFHDENPGGSGFQLSGMDKFVNVTPSGPINITWMILKIYYTDAEVAAANLIESTLRMQYYNETSGIWEVFNPPRGGVNTIKNYVWANVTHFSIFGVGGSKSSSGGSSGVTGSGGGGGGSRTYYKDLGILTTAGIKIIAKKGDTIKFEHFGKIFNLKLKSLTQNEIVTWLTNPGLLTYSFLPVSLIPQTPKYLDLDGNGKADTMIQITSMMSLLNAEIFIQARTEGTPTTAPVIQPEVIEDKTDKPIEEMTPEEIEEKKQIELERLKQQPGKFKLAIPGLKTIAIIAGIIVVLGIIFVVAKPKSVVVSSETPSEPAPSEPAPAEPEPKPTTPQQEPLPPPPSPQQPPESPNPPIN